MTGSAACLRGRQLADHQLALDLQPDEEKEDRHQAVVDPVQQRLVEHERRHAERHVRLEQVLVEAAGGRVHQDEAEQRRGEQHDAAGRLVLEEGFDAADARAVRLLAGHLLLALAARHTGAVGNTRALAHKALVAASGNSSRLMLAATLASTAEAEAPSEYAGEAPLSRLPRYIAASRSPVPCGAEGRRRT